MTPAPRGANGEVRWGVRHLLTSLAVVVALSACSRAERDPQAGSAAPSATTEANDPSPASLPPQDEVPPIPKAPRRSGIAGMVFHATHDLTLSEAQKAAIDGLEAPLRGADDATKAASRALQSSIVAGIRAGKMDEAKTRTAFAALDAAQKDRVDRQAAALNGLHALLDTMQRAELAQAVRARLAAHSLRAPDAPDDEPGDWTRRRLDRMTDELGLDDAQRKRVGDLLAKSNLANLTSLKAEKEEASARAEAVVRAFSRDDGFDATKLDLRPGTGKSAHDYVEREVGFITRLIGVLTPAQREQMASGSFQ